MKEITEDKGRVRPVVEGDFQCDENGNSTRFYEVLSIIGYIKDDGTKIGYISKTDVPIGTSITDTEYWYPFQVIAVPKGDKGDKGEDGKSAYELYIEHGGTITPVEAWLESLQGKDGKDAQPLLLRISADGQSLEISDDGGQTWYLFEKNFNKLRILGYVDNISKLPRVAEIGDIYGVLQEPVEQEEKAIYVLYINTVKNWLKDYTITRVYDYDTELPSSSIDGTTVLVPVDYLTLDKQKIDGYKVYRFSVDRNGWILILDTAEIYVSKDDIINRGDNKYALVQGEEPNTYDLYRRDVGWVYFGTNNSISYLLVQNVEEGTDNNILSGKSVKDALYTKVDKEEGKSLIDSDYANCIHYIENEEFVRAYIDGNDKFLWGIRRDSQIIYGAGVPVQIKDYIQEKIKDLSLDEYEDIVTFLDGLESDTDFKTLRELLNEKVDKEENKSLIDKDFANGISYIENPEFEYIKLDNNNNIIEAVLKDGKKVLGAGLKIRGDLELNSANITTIKNPEFLALWLLEDKVLFGVNKDGNFHFGAGVPKQVIDYINQKIKELLGEGDTTTIIDTLHEITSFLDGFVSGSNLLEYLNNTYGYYEKNPEYIKVYLDADGKIIKAIKPDGTTVLSSGVEFSNSIISVVKHPEFIVVYFDNDKHILFGIRNDGEFIFGCGVPKQIQSYIEETLNPIKEAVGRYIYNPEYIETITDNVGRILAGRNIDGSAFENIGFYTPKINIDNLELKNIEDPEGRIEVVIDKEGKLLSYRKQDGTKVEKLLEVSNLTIQNPSSFIAQMRAQGYDIAATDYSEAKELHIPEPYCARINFSNIFAMPTTKTDNFKAYMEFWDMQGNYFKKEVIMNAQGRSTMADAKKNIAIDICNNNGWNDDDTFKLQIGDWVPQDSFHLKAYMKDPFKCLGPISYAFYNEVVRTRGILKDYVWKRALINTDNVTPTSTGVSDEKSKTQYTNGATCFPQCFPCIVYLNGEFYGIYSWQIKKHRDNYQMSKKKPKHIHLDNNVSNRLLYANGDASQINWNALDVYNQGLEIRNPKPKKKKDGWNLVTLNGSIYDADAGGGELMSPTMIVDREEVVNPDWDSTNESHIKSYEVKNYILDLSKVLPSMDTIATISTNNGDIKLKNYQGVYNNTDNFSKGVWVSDGNNTYYMSIHSINTGNSLSDTNYWVDVTQAVIDIKTTLETHWDVDNLIDYEIVSDIICNVDGFGDNWQWITYDGVKWYICIYDCDMTFGYHQGTIITPRTDHLMKLLQYEYVLNFYEKELDERYAELRKLGIIDADNIIKMFEAWINRLGNSNTYEKEWEKWPTPYFNDSIMRVYKWLKATITNMDTVYNYNI